MKELKIPQVYQIGNAWCGPATLLAVLQWLDLEGRSTLRSLAREMHCSRDGTIAREMLAALRKRGVEADYVTGLTVDDLIDHRSKGCPAILQVQAHKLATTDYADHLGSLHFVTVVAITATDVYVMDTGTARAARARIPRRHLYDRWQLLDDDTIVRCPAILVHATGPTRVLQRRDAVVLT